MLTSLPGNRLEAWTPRRLETISGLVSISSMQNQNNGMINNLLLLLIKIYQVSISPVLGPACRFVPTCSEYAYQAICAHGTLRGGLLAIKRILRCHPFNPGGFDPVP
jgi:hypothetical protein